MFSQFYIVSYIHSLLSPLCYTQYLYYISLDLHFTTSSTRSKETLICSTERYEGWHLSSGNSWHSGSSLADNQLAPLWLGWRVGGEVDTCFLVLCQGYQGRQEDYTGTGAGCTLLIRDCFYLFISSVQSGLKLA